MSKHQPVYEVRYFSHYDYSLRVSCGDGFFRSLEKAQAKVDQKNKALLEKTNRFEGRGDTPLRDEKYSARLAEWEVLRDAGLRDESSRPIEPVKKPLLTLDDLEEYSGFSFIEEVKFEDAEDV